MGVIHPTGGLEDVETAFERIHPVIHPTGGLEDTATPTERLSDVIHPTGGLEVFQRNVGENA